MMSADTLQDVPNAASDPEARPEPPQLGFWQEIKRCYPKFDVKYIPLVETLHAFPSAKDHQLAAKLGISISTVSRRRNDPDFWPVFKRYALKRSELFTSKFFGVREQWLDKISQDLEKGHDLDPTDATFFGLAAKSLGLLGPDSQNINITNTGEQKVSVVSARFEATLEQIQAAGRAQSVAVVTRNTPPNCEPTPIPVQIVSNGETR